ncbi:MAG: AmmeMemoRadiSam system radical SAM enzyme [candidate division WOR-3 bacterium]
MTKKPVAKYWVKANDNKIRCLLCPRECLIEDSKKGFCGTRTNINGNLIATAYGEIVSIAMDPMEKKPLYHFYPSSYILSTATCGCNLNCIHCQNWSISQLKQPTEYIDPETLVALAKKKQSKGICFTYTEPMIWFEYILDVAKLAKKEKLPIVLVTNGLINPNPLEELIEYVDAMNIDLKSMKPEFYKNICNGPIEPILYTIRRSYEKGVHIEVTNLIIPTLNDSEEEIKELTDFLSSISPDIPLHITRFFPNYKLTNLPPTPIETLLKAREIAISKLNFVYVGNVVNKELNSTFCPTCKNLLIERDYFYNVKSFLDGNRCPKCKTPIPGKF